MKVNDRRTLSMLQRVPVILAVTAASYGLQLPPQLARSSGQGVSSSAAFNQVLQQAGTRPQQEPGRRRA